MSIGISLQLASVAFQNVAYFACLSWLAWSVERRQGVDAFQLVVAYAVGIWLVALSVEQFNLHVPAAVLMASAVAYAINDLWLNLFKHANSNYSLVQAIVLASVALIAFDWATSYTPVSLPVRSAGALDFGLLCAFVAWAWVLLNIRSPLGMMLRLGTKNRWAAEYWGIPLAGSSMSLRACGLLCWVAVLTIPMATTGLLSSTILKDVALGILIARVASTRGPIILLAGCATLALLRTAVGFAFVSSAGPPMVEATVFLCLLVWLRYRGSRTPWGEVHGH